MAKDGRPLPAQVIETRIFVLRGHRVTLDRDFAELDWRRNQGSQPGRHNAVQTASRRTACSGFTAEKADAVLCFV